MLDVSFTELMLIGVVALVVIGPERLPKVARTAGHLLGRAQRYVTDVKSDIQRELDLDEMNKLKKQMDDAAQSLQSSMRETADTIQNPLNEARKSLTEASASVENLMEQARQEVKPAAAETPPAATPAQATESNAQTPAVEPQETRPEAPTAETTEADPQTAAEEQAEPEHPAVWETMPAPAPSNEESSGKPK